MCLATRVRFSHVSVGEVGGGGDCMIVPVAQYVSAEAFSGVMGNTSTERIGTSGFLFFLRCASVCLASKRVRLLPYLYGGAVVVYVTVVVYQVGGYIGLSPDSVLPLLLAGRVEKSLYSRLPVHV